MKIRGILIIIVVLFGLAFAFGCKERFNKVECSNCKREYSARKCLTISFYCECGTICEIIDGKDGIEIIDCTLEWIEPNRPEPNEPENILRIDN